MKKLTEKQKRTAERLKFLEVIERLERVNEIEMDIQDSYDYLRFQRKLIEDLKKELKIKNQE